MKHQELSYTGGGMIDQGREREVRTKDHKERNVGEHPDLCQHMGHLSRVLETTTASLLSPTWEDHQMPRSLRFRVMLVCASRLSNQFHPM